jgi:hypothetical protein
MNLKNFSLIEKLIINFVAFVGFLSLSSISIAEISIEDLVRSKADSAKGAAQDGGNTKNIPGYSEEEKNKKEQELASIQADNKADNLKISGSQLRDREVRNSPGGTIATMVEATDISRVTGDQCKGCEKYGELEMFNTADKYMQDPIGQMQLIKDQGCKEMESNKNRGFVKKENIETYTDEIEEFRVCEMPVTNFKCNKVLSVHCKKTAQCDYGGITKGSVSAKMIFDVSNGSLTLGTDGDNYFRGQCATFEETATFHIAKASLVTAFQLVHVKFDDYIQLKLNGHTFYVGPDGGDYVKVDTREIEKERTVYDRVNNGWSWFRVARQEKYKESITEVYNGNIYKPCERDTSWNNVVAVDLKPYLKDGENVLQMKILVSGGGEGWLKIQAKQQCCANDEWDSKWVESCE